MHAVNSALRGGFKQRLNARFSRVVLRCALASALVYISGAFSWRICASAAL